MAEKKQVTDFRKLVSEAEAVLSKADAPEVDVYELIRFVFELSRTDILLNPVIETEKVKLDFFKECVNRRADGYPLQYIIGEWDFYGNTFAVGEGVLIPRNETEQIAYEACRFLNGKKGITVFDLCSGSGCIGLSVAANNPSCKVFLMDISETALDYERKNLNRFSLDNVTIMDYDIFSGFDAERLPLPDVILCNPTYVTETEFGSLQRELSFEPKCAIVSGEDGYEFYRCLTAQWLPFIKSNGFFMLECGEGQPENVVGMINKLNSVNANRFKAECVDDMYGVCRFVRGTAD